MRSYWKNVSIFSLIYLVPIWLVSLTFSNQRWVTFSLLIYLITLVIIGKLSKSEFLKMILLGHTKYTEQNKHDQKHKKWQTIFLSFLMLIFVLVFSGLSSVIDIDYLSNDLTGPTVVTVLLLFYFAFDPIYYKHQVNKLNGFDK